MPVQAGVTRGQAGYREVKWDHENSSGVTNRKVKFPPYSLDLAPCEFWVFTKMKTGYFFILLQDSELQDIKLILLAK